MLFILLETAARHGLDPLPGYLAPPEAADPGHPLLLQTGFREKTYHHSRFRDQAWARKVSPDPEVRLHPETAAAHGLAEGDWVEVEVPGGPAPAGCESPSPTAPSPAC